jgi:hypothetical protein
MPLIEVACFPSLQSHFTRWAILKPYVLFLRKANRRRYGRKAPTLLLTLNRPTPVAVILFIMTLVCHFAPNKASDGNSDDFHQRCIRALDNADYTVIVKCQDIDDPSLTVKSVRT